jgi:hypothetical protein
MNAGAEKHSIEHIPPSEVDIRSAGRVLNPKIY